jgi:hypothetical protein
MSTSVDERNISIDKIYAYGMSKLTTCYSQVVNLHLTFVMPIKF